MLHVGYKLRTFKCSYCIWFIYCFHQRQSERIILISSFICLERGMCSFGNNLFFSVLVIYLQNEIQIFQSIQQLFNCAELLHVCARGCFFLLKGFYSKNNLCSSSLLVKLYIKKCAGFVALMNYLCTLGDLA